MARAVIRSRDDRSGALAGTVHCSRVDARPQCRTGAVSSCKTVLGISDVRKNDVSNGAYLSPNYEIRVLGAAPFGQKHRTLVLLTMSSGECEIGSCRAGEGSPARRHADRYRDVTPDTPAPPYVSSPRML